MTLTSLTIYTSVASTTFAFIYVHSIIAGPAMFAWSAIALVYVNNLSYAFSEGRYIPIMFYCAEGKVSQ